MPLFCIRQLTAFHAIRLGQIELRPGTRFVAELLEIRGDDVSNDRYDFRQVGGGLQQPRFWQLGNSVIP